MTTDRVVFMPYKRDQVADFVEQAEEATRLGAVGKTHHARQFSVVCYDDPGEPLEELGFGWGSRILIAGHGQPGRPYISNSSGYGQKQYVPFNVVGDRLIEKGLQKRYVGTIGCDVCYSAVKSDANPPFADLLARYLHEKGYSLVNTIGYLGPMGAVPEKLIGDHKFRHRVVDLYAGTADEETVKSSDLFARTRYFGMFSVPPHLTGLRIADSSCPAY
jgi:hypothetical protein